MDNNNTMDDFQAALDASFQSMKEGDTIKGYVIDVDESGILVDLNYYMEGYIPKNEVSNNPSFSIHMIHPGDEVTAVILESEDETGRVLLSLRQASERLAWSTLLELKSTQKVITVKVSSSVSAGAIAYVNEIRGFIPASKLSTEYVDDPSIYVGQELAVIVSDVDESKQKLILSHKDIEQLQIIEQKNQQISRLQKGTITTGVVEKIMPYGAFVKLNEHLSGLVHISQICAKRIKSPNEVLKLGETVTVKVVDIKDGKINLSMTAVTEEIEPLDNDSTDPPFSYSTGEDATTDLGSLLKNFKLS